MTQASVRGFFAAYAAAYEALDGDAVAAHCAVPCGISQGEAVTWWAEHEPMRDNMRRLCALYAQAGLARAVPALEHVHLLGAHDAFALVRWTLARADGSLLQRFATGYHLKHTAAGLKIVLVTAFDEDLNALRAAAR